MEKKVYNEEDVKLIKRYRNSVDSITKTVIRHNNIKIPDGYHVDHIFPVSYGRLLNIPPYVIAHINNIQILEGTENMKKSNNVDTIPMFIQQYMLGITKKKLDEDYKNKKKIGIEMAKKNGVYKGRKRGSCESEENFLSKHKDVIELMVKGYSHTHISSITGKHVNTITKIRVIKEKLGGVDKYREVEELLKKGYAPINITKIVGIHFNTVTKIKRIWEEVKK